MVIVLGMYIQRSDVENNYGATYVAEWSSYSEGNNPTGNVNRINLAISWAEAQVNNKLGNSPYLVPIQGTSGSTPVDIVDMCSELAGFWLWRSRALKQSAPTQKAMMDRAKAVNIKLLQIINGTYPLDAIRNNGRTNTPFVPRGGYGSGFGGGGCGYGVY